MIRKWVLLGIMILAVPTAQATVYYVDCIGGADKNSGTAQKSAWKTIEKVNSVRLLGGDLVLLKRGCSWNTGLNPVTSGQTAQNRITFDSYGSGEPPTLDGAKPIPVISFVKLPGVNTWKSSAVPAIDGAWGVSFEKKWVGQPVTRIEDATTPLSWYWDGRALYVGGTVTSSKFKDQYRSVEFWTQTNGVKLDWFDNYVTLRHLRVLRFDRSFSVSSKGVVLEYCRRAPKNGHF